MNENRGGARAVRNLKPQRLLQCTSQCDRTRRDLPRQETFIATWPHVNATWTLQLAKSSPEAGPWKEHIVDLPPRWALFAVNSILDTIAKLESNPEAI